MPTLKLNKELWERVTRCAELAGYSGPQEFIEHLIARELARLEAAESDEDLLKKLKGLGYID